LFRYNKFWHFWFQLDNRDYLRATLLSLASAALAMLAVMLFSSISILPLPSIALFFVPSLVIAGTIALFTVASNFFYNRQNQQLIQVKETTSDEELKKEIDLYLNRRVVCPRELLDGKHLNLLSETEAITEEARNHEDAIAILSEDSLIMEKKDVLQMERQPATHNRNPNFIANGQFGRLFMKEAAANDTLSEIAAREMAEIMGFKNLVPQNTCTTITNPRILSREAIEEFIDKESESGRPDGQIKNTAGVQNAVTKFIFNTKTAMYRNKAKVEQDFKLLYIQKFIPNAISGSEWYTKLINETGEMTIDYRAKSRERQQQRNFAKDVVERIDATSYQENFLLHLLLGSQDANPGNTLFIDGPDNKKLLHSIDHERIMPEDNYNVTKKIPFSHAGALIEKDVTNVFPIRLWLAGLPQANIPFTREVIEKVLASLNPERILAYHNRKKLFSDASIGAQLDRIDLIRTLFKEESQKAVITLTPKQLFLKFINNHPTYDFLKNELELHDLSIFMLLGQIPEDADLSLLRHPLQYIPIYNMYEEYVQSIQEGRGGAFSEKSFKSSHSHNASFFFLATINKTIRQLNTDGLDILSCVASQLTP
jgi:hypothetical protein